ncbi:hypothetical protein EMIHUDRAFT_214156 [Emiliania huxleyi CCMP1516]|uniref:Uncharacterized protein n=2 Tax=Emiliania huxleyi TaxID=2903 RepID=A0A0D3IKP8_EMIH1|nr:hypothetical protein EMIHUDRAFT_214156 [Emiliania huxleyi CCMP1516]EOD11833.1 hypothetical protein EMIHUDRAFT_214156 [Emiliania huxleyi CCMP1516]|eukprot:XP_005764262.1 hypothetical protein EMIHUDRAFT_214156 [Emiliania huxleyi CCMP1516]
MAVRSKGSTELRQTARTQTNNGFITAPEAQDGRAGGDVLSTCAATGLVLSTTTEEPGEGADPLGDAASNIGRLGHCGRHNSLLAALAKPKVMRSVWGMLVEVEPRDHLGYSNDYRPDVSVAGAGRSRSRLVGDVKFKDSLSSNPEDVGQRGAFVGLGNTEPGTSADVFGLEQRGAVGDGDFRPSDGGGYVCPHPSLAGSCVDVKNNYQTLYLHPESERVPRQCFERRAKLLSSEAAAVLERT